MEAVQVIALLMSAGFGAILLELIKRLFDLMSNRDGKRRSEVDKAWGHRDEEARKRRLAEEHAYVMRRIALEAPCVPKSSIPPFPSYGHGGTDNSK